MKRRKAIGKTSHILKTAIFAPSVLQAFQACQRESTETTELLVFTDPQNELLIAIIDTIIPKTDTLSASEAKVNVFIDLVLHDVFEEDVRQKFLLGLADFDRECISVTKKSFKELGPKARFKYLEKVDKEVMGKEFSGVEPFYFSFKQLTLNAYFSSKEGVTQNLNYVPIPGAYQADISLSEGDKITVGNHM